MQRERKLIVRERTAAPIRNALLEQLTMEPVVIHDLVGEDGSVGGNPAVDIQMKNFSIDLAGVTLLEDVNLTLVCLFWSA